MPKDPICDMDVDPDDAAGKSEHNGKTYYFCSTHCKEKFDADPEQFLGPKAPRTEALTLAVTGMSCATCAQNIEKALRKVEGVTDAAVNFASERARVTFDPTAADRDALVRAVRDAGYDVKTGGSKAVLGITGMTCQSCANAIRKSLEKLDGVTAANVNFAANEATVRFDPDKVGERDLVKAVEDVGYGVSDRKTQGGDDEDESIRHMKQARRRMIAAWVLTAPVILCMLPEMFGLFKIPAYDWIMVVLALPVLAVPGFNTCRSAVKSLIHFSANMDVLIMLGSGAAFITGPFNLAGAQVFNYAGVGAMIMAFHLTGRYVEAKARGRASQAIRKLMELGARTARIVRDGEEKEVPVDQVEVGDVMLVKPGEKIPTDGEVVDGESAVDESMATGESIPASRKKGDAVIGATINQQGVLKVKATGVGEDAFLAQVIRMVQEAQGSRVPIQGFADRVTGWFVPAVMGLSVLTFLLWLVFHPFFKTIAAHAAVVLPWINPDVGALSLAVFAGVAVMVIACPCALGLATPTALMVGSGMGARNGILIRSGEAIQIMKDVKTIVFDKTGTLTRGKPEVSEIVAAGGADEGEVLYWAASLEANSEHPLAQAVVRRARDRNVQSGAVADFSSVPGKGITGKVDDHPVLVGTRTLMEEQGVDVGPVRSDLERLENDGITTSIVAVDGRVAGVIGISDTVKDDSAEALSALKALGFELAMITGDNQRTAEAIARQVGIDRVLANVLPDQKAEEIRRLKEQVGCVAMVGDGINDAPALTQADVGIAIGTGTDIAIESSDIILVRGELSAVVSAVKLSRATFRKIRQNLFWAFGYNLVAIPLAMLGLLHPLIAEAAMAMSSITVVTNSVLLQRADIRPRRD